MRLVNLIVNFVLIGSPMFALVFLMGTKVIPNGKEQLAFAIAYLTMLCLILWRAQSIARKMNRMAIQEVRRSLNTSDLVRYRRNRLVLSFLPLTIPMAVAAASHISAACQWSVAALGVGFCFYLFFVNRKLARFIKAHDGDLTPLSTD